MFSMQVNERTSATYQATLVDAAGTPLPGSALSTLELWLYDRVSNTIINTRGTLGGSGQNVLQQNGVTVDNSGLLTWQMAPADHVVFDPAREEEDHRAVFKATWPTGNGLTHEIEIRVRNLLPLA